MGNYVITFLNHLQGNLSNIYQQETHFEVRRRENVFDIK
jgi:hypothetical protein